MKKLAAFIAFALAGTASAQEDPLSSPTASGPELLRAVSLDLRGVVPTLDEYRAVQSGQSVDDMVDAWLDRPEFAERVVKHHRSLVWNNVSGIRLANNRARLTVRNGAWFRNSNSTEFRGRFNQGCSTRDAEFDEFGWPIREEVSPGIYDEGTVWVEPYWDPENPIRVCAFDAMDQRYAPDGTDCASINGVSDDQCGCGPNLDWCMPNIVEREILGAMGADIDHRVRAMVEQDQSYLDLLTNSTGYFNGPLTHFLKNQTGRRGAVRFDPPAVHTDRLPDLQYTDADAVPVALGEQHSGVLTSPAWLLRFQTQRSRANQFHNSFLCQPFVPPSSGLPEVSEEDQSLDLTAREGCQYCHALLEPAAAHWGRWSESGGSYLDPVEYPGFSEECDECATRGGCSSECRTFYVTRELAPEQQPFIGYLVAFEFLEERHMPHVEEGPSLLVNRTAADGRLPECVAEKAVTWLVGREPMAEEEAWIDELATNFATSGFDYKTLIRDIVTSENYRRLP